MLVMSGLLLVARRRAGLQLARELEPHGHPDQHAQARLLRNHHADGAQPLIGILLAGRAGDLALVGVLEPAALLEGLVDHALQGGRGVRDHLLRMAEALRVAQRLDGGVDLLCGVLPPRGHAAQARPIPYRGLIRASMSPHSTPMARPSPATSMLASTASGMSASTTARTATPSMSASSSWPRRRPRSTGTAHAASSPSAAPC